MNLDSMFTTNELLTMVGVGQHINRMPEINSNTLKAEEPNHKTGSSGPPICSSSFSNYISIETDLIAKFTKAQHLHGNVQKTIIRGSA